MPETIRRSGGFARPWLGGFALAIAVCLPAYVRADEPPKLALHELVLGASHSIGSHEIAALALIVGQSRGALELRPGLRAPPDSEQQVSVHAGQQVIGLQTGLLEQRLERLQGLLGTKGHRYRYGAIQLDDRRAGEFHQCVVQCDDAQPVGVVSGPGERMTGYDGRLQRVRMVRRQPGDRLTHLGQPVAELGRMHGVAQPGGLRVHRCGDVPHPVMVAFQPGRLGQPGRGRPGPLQPADLAQAVVSQGFALSELVEAKPSLEQVFLDLTRETSTIAAAAA